MPRYEVVVWYTAAYSVEVEADSADNAYLQVQEMIEEGIPPEVKNNPNLIKEIQVEELPPTA